MSEPIANEQKTSRFSRFASLFFGLYFLLAFFPFPLSMPFEHFYTEQFYKWSDGYDKMFLPIAKWVGGALFHNADGVVLQPTGAGDTMFQNMMKLFWLGTALILALTWVLVDRKSKTLEKANDLLRVNVRFFLVTILFTYGFGKLHQFPSIPDMSLDTTWGETSPMGVVWKMMMSNQNYTAFTGLLEAAPAFLLMFRRTANLGALLTAGVMIHIFSLNMFFDVPVKLHSLNYIIMSLYVASPMFGRLIRVLLLNQPSEPIKLIPEVKFKWLRVAVVLVATSYWGYYSYTRAKSWYEDIQALNKPKPIYVGSWITKSHIVNGKELVGQPNTDAFKGINIVDSKFLSLVTQDNRKSGFKAKFDAPNNSLEITSYDSEQTYKLQYEIEGDNLTLSGKLPQGETVIIARKSNADRVIFSKPFRWISEKPDNR
jgi:hypothetical protein